MVSPDGDVAALLRALGRSDLPELLLVFGHGPGEDLHQVLGMLGTDTHDRLGPGLVGTGDLVEEDEGPFVFAVGDLDAVGIDRVQGLGDLDLDLMCAHTDLVGRERS